MNFVYIWERIENETKSNDFDELQTDFGEIQEIQQFANSQFPQFNGWGYQVIGHDDFANLSGSTQIVFESDEEDPADQDDIIVVNNSSDSQNYPFVNEEDDEDDDEIKVIGFTG